MRTRLLLSLALLLPALPIIGADDDEDEMTRLVIEVKSKAGKPIDRASVVVRFEEGRSIKKFGKKIKTNWELRTNQLGQAKIPPIPQGKILIQVIAKGYQTFGERYEVTEPEKTIEIQLNPPQPQYSAH